MTTKRIPEPEKDPWNGSVASSRRVEGSAWQSSVLRLRSATLQQPRIPEPVEGAASILANTPSLRAEKRRGNLFDDMSFL